MSKETVKKGQIERTPNGAQFTLDKQAITKLKAAGARVISGGGNVLTMEEGQTTGPWLITAIETRTLDKRYEPVEVLTGECQEQSFQLPAATSFRDKCAKAKIKVGDVIAITREADYRARGKDCEGYSLLVISQS